MRHSSGCAPMSRGSSSAPKTVPLPGANANRGAPRARNSARKASWKRGSLAQNASRQGLFGSSIPRRQHVRAASASAPRRERSGPFYLALRIEAEPVAAPFSPVQSDAIAAAELVERRVPRAAIAIEANQRQPSLRAADPHPLLAFLGRRQPDHPPQIALGSGSGASEDERREGEHLVGAQTRRLGELLEEWRRMPAHLGGAPVPRRGERRTWHLREAGSQREPAFAQQRVTEREEGSAGLAQRGLDDCNRALQAPDECQGIG